jgi:hypothetical protein
MPKGTITMTFDLEVSDEALAALLLRHHMNLHPPLQRAMNEADFDRGLVDPADPLRVEGEQSLAPPPSAHPPAASPSITDEGTQGKPKVTQTKAPKAPARDKANGAGDGAGRQPLAEPAMRALLSSVSDVHPQRVAGVIAILTEHGGNKRLMDCPQATWVAIEDAAQAALQQYRPAVA